MTQDAPNPSSAPHEVNEGYDFQDIRAHLDGQALPPHFVIRRRGIIVGVCLGRKWHPRAEDDPAEIWVGKKDELPGWGRKLAETVGALPVYVRRQEGGLWVYIGCHEVTGSTTDIAAIKERLQPPVITAISRIIFLKRLPETAAPATSE